jgi:hypothetical protein
MPTKENGSGGQQEYDPTTGKFAPKGGWASFSSFVQSNSPYKSGSERSFEKLGYNAQTIQKGDYERLKSKFPFLTDEGLAKLPSFSDLKEIAGIDLYDDSRISEKEYGEALAKIKEKYSADKEKESKEFSEFRKDFERKRESISKAMKQAGFSDSQSEKVTLMQKRFSKAQEQASKELQSLGENASGYSKGKSVRDLKATIEGRFPLTQASDILGVSPDKIKKFFKTNGEWHHTGGGGLFNQTDFYDLSSLSKFANEYGEGENPDSEDYSDAIKTLKEIYGGFSNFKKKSDSEPKGHEKE